MLYRAHLVAGVAAGGGIAAVARGTGAVPGLDGQIGVFCLFVVFSLLPDLDTASVTQRWFYRCMFIYLLILLAQARVAEAAFAGAAATLPLVHRHRGWMHAPWAAVIVPLAGMLLWDLYWKSLSPGDLLSGATLAGFAADVMTGRGVFLAAMMGGYLLHLVVDFWAPAALRWGRLP
jgi:membrane-bound metal-dependent hydrolase YbcI (DUF457 family)